VGLETEWRADRSRPWALARARADDTVADLAAAVGRSVSWVKNPLLQAALRAQGASRPAIGARPAGRVAV
jgi:hypothetical protein